MKKMLLGVFALLLFTLLGLACWWAWNTGILTRSQTTGMPATPSQVEVTPLTQTYTNEVFNFSFKYPDGYAVRSIEGEGSVTILLERALDSRGIQIHITPYTDKDIAITADRVQRDVPDISVEEPQPILLGETGEGLAFKSDNETFDGDSREAWFIVAGNLYQISTYAEYDELLKAIFATWSFF